MKHFILLLFLFCSFISIQAQQTVSGVVSNSLNTPIAGVNVVVKNTSTGTTTNANGAYSLSLATGDYTLIFSNVGFINRKLKITVGNEDLTENIQLTTRSYNLEPLNVTATKATKNTPASYTNLSAAAIEKRNVGVDVPYLLDLTPSAVVTSDAGTGIGYTGIRVRGSDPTRINVQINGIPLNDSESQGVFWVNLPDFASSVSSIQIQRGVGTSTNGAGAFGATINMETDKIKQQPWASIGNSIGSFNTRKHNIEVGSGLIKDHWYFSSRLSRIYSDGFIDRARADLNSWYLSGTYLAKTYSIKANFFSGQEETYQSWYGAPLSQINAGNLTYNPSGLNFDEEGNIRFYEDEVDNYKQTHAHLIYNQDLQNGLLLNLGLHYTKGQGYFEQFKEDDDLENYSIAPVNLVNENGETFIQETSDIIRRRWLDNDFYGMIANLKYVNNDWEAVLGGGYNIYEGAHFGEVIWARFASNSDIYDRYYDNDATKKDGNVFLKINRQFSDRFNAYVDLQVRMIDYDFFGIVQFDSTFAQLDQNEKLTFFNPKLGATYALNNDYQLYGSWSVAQREPNRSDYVDAPINQRPKPEKLNDFELGLRGRYPKGSFTVNGYYMLYKDQLALDGGVNDVGEYTRINIPESYRLGIELVNSTRINNWLNWGANLTLSRNKIPTFTENIDDFTDEGSVYSITHENTDIAFSPNIIAGSTLKIKAFSSSLGKGSHSMNIDVLTKYVGSQFLDNTSNQNGNLADVLVGTAEDVTFLFDDEIDFDPRTLEAYLTNDVQLNYTLNNIFTKEINLFFLVRNVFDEQYISNAYTYRYIFDGYLYEGAGYFPQAGRNFMAGINFNF